MKDVYLRSIRRITVVCRFPSSLWVSSALTCLFAVLWEGWKLALPGIRVAAWEESDRSALHQREDVIVQLLFQRLDSENSISCLQYLSVPPGLSLRFAFWPGRSGRALRRCSWCAGCVCEGSGSSQHWEAVKSFRLMCWDTYSVVEVGLGGWFSGQQSSVGEGRPSESSLSRWTCGKVWSTTWKNIRQTDRLLGQSVGLGYDDRSLLLNLLLHYFYSIPVCPWQPVCHDGWSWLCAHATRTALRTHEISALISFPAFA